MTQDHELGTSHSIGKIQPRRDPQKFPVCPKCAEIHAGLPVGGDE